MRSEMMILEVCSRIGGVVAVWCTALKNLKGDATTITNASAGKLLASGTAVDDLTWVQVLRTSLLKASQRSYWLCYHYRCCGVTSNTRLGSVHLVSQMAQTLQSTAMIQSHQGSISSAHVE